MSEDRIRLDRWLFHIRAFKTRTLASDRIQSGGVRVNGAPCNKPARLVGAGTRSRSRRPDGSWRSRWSPPASGAAPPARRGHFISI
ncbi:S4 domain-containing protein [Paracoccus cavernae]|uniref:S4 domain-containing protein n=1 Tax=Paracoccus cavernae TaxID=1571207 RepID=A0ABT8D5X7_9RHOB|nr:S4 domain-containing protein [Paracoccus cavernae]